MNRVLMISYYFPPLGGIGSLRAAGFAEHLPQFGWDAVVLAPSNGAYFRDPSLSFRADRVVRARSLELSRVGKLATRAGGDDVVAASVGAVRGALRGMVRRWVYFPDAQIGWFPAAVVAGRRLIRDRRIDAIFSSSFPVTAHLVARALSRRAGIPWIAEFRDPWSMRLTDAELPQRRRAERLERSIAKEAAAIVMPSPSWSAEHARRWGREVVTIPNGFDHVPSGSPPEDRLVVCYLGSYYPGRQDLSALWTALRRLAGDPSFRPVGLRVVGGVSAAMRAELRSHGVDSLLQETGFLPHAEALKAMASSSVLIAAGPAQEERAGSGVIPAKLFEYLATALPIVWVGGSTNDGASLLAAQPGCRVLACGDVDGAVEALAAAEPRLYERDLAGSSRTDRARQLAGVLGAESDRHAVIVTGGPGRT